MEKINNPKEVSALKQEMAEARCVELAVLVADTLELEEKIKSGTATKN